MVTLPGQHQGFCTAVAIDSSGRRIASGGTDLRIIIRDQDKQSMSERTIPECAQEEEVLPNDILWVDAGYGNVYREVIGIQFLDGTKAGVVIQYRDASGACMCSLPDSGPCECERLPGLQYYRIEEALGVPEKATMVAFGAIPEARDDGELSFDCNRMTASLHTFGNNNDVAAVRVDLSDIRKGLGRRIIGDRVWYLHDRDEGFCFVYSFELKPGVEVEPVEAFLHVFRIRKQEVYRFELPVDGGEYTPVVDPRGRWIHLIESTRTIRTYRRIGADGWAMDTTAQSLHLTDSKDKGKCAWIEIAKASPSGKYIAALVWPRTIAVVSDDWKTTVAYVELTDVQMERFETGDIAWFPDERGMAIGCPDGRVRCVRW